MKMRTLGTLKILTSILIPGVLATACAENIASDTTVPPETSKNCITKEQVTSAQKTWADSIVAIGKAYKNSGDYKALAAKTVDDLYGYDEGTVLFKPTKASEGQFRLTEKDAVSYFVKGVISEDQGFALQPWSKVRFENAGMSIACGDAVAMGNYYFTDANTNKEVKVEYTFGYRKNSDGNLLIDLHHSSLPFQPTK